ncbi:mannose-1-phosphate guanylyltransferase/mannose-6-phosphate isomerase [Massilia sp. W12]|uniref:mannose-1-phosphate guanylyltransferase/mannose-6-phosphate isomerase n=1 Tax=Massilia sp. W12 TaxID=3126507 RepID=UPI0030CDBA59
MTIIPVILSGGVGARLWPVSRELHPKPFMRLSDGQSLLQKAFVRAAALPDVAEILTVTNRDLYFKTEDDYREVNPAQLPASFILEPFGRNTAAAIASAARTVADLHGPQALMLVLPADHLISNQQAFDSAVAQAVVLAQQGKLVTFGITPNAPETGFGYIEAEGSQVKRFVEKPSLDKAREYLASGRYLWNAGMFCFSAGAMLEQMQQHEAAVLQAVDACLQKSSRAQRGDKSVQIELDAASFKNTPDISIDYAVMERSSAVAVVACDIGWSDIGSWSAISDLVEVDEQGNGVLGEAYLHDSSNCYIQSNERVVSAVGVRNLIIIDTSDALLVVDRSRVQDVKQIVAQLKANSHDAYKLHREVHRPWGTYTVLEEGSRFKIKRIEVKPGASLSLQMHHHRSEHWIVVSGMAKVVNGEREFLVGTNESTFIPAGHKHRLSNPGVTDLVMIEVQSGEYLGEDDIVRFEDHYGRA